MASSTEISDGRRRRVYEITADGKEALGEEIRSWNNFRRVLEEIESHIHDVIEHMRTGATRSEAVAQVIAELGPPDVVGAAFSIRRADRDPTWRWAAWACTGCVVAYLILEYASRLRLVVM